MFLQNFENKYKNLLGNRYETFFKCFEYLEKLNKEKYFILETGMARQENNYSGDGQSTILFDEYINYKDGVLYSVDIDQHAVDYSFNKVSKKTKLFCEDSVKFLYNLNNVDNLPKIDLLYLDSYDLNWNNPHPSAMHHVKELLSIIPKLSSNCLLVVDDNQKDLGKGKYISEFMKDIGINYYFNEYQTGWIWR